MPREVRDLPVHYVESTSNGNFGHFPKSIKSQILSSGLTRIIHNDFQGLVASAVDLAGISKMAGGMINTNVGLDQSKRAQGLTFTLTLRDQINETVSATTDPIRLNNLVMEGNDNQ